MFARVPTENPKDTTISNGINGWYKSSIWKLLNFPKEKITIPKIAPTFQANIRDSDFIPQPFPKKLNKNGKGRKQIRTINDFVSHPRFMILFTALIK